jgi:adenosine kinase
MGAINNMHAIWACYNWPMSARKNILVIGSIAYDNLMRFSGLFKDVMVAGKYSFALTVSERDISYGGCGANIAYGLKMMGASPLLASAVGRDFADYKARLDGLEIDSRAITVSKDHLTASAFICTDKEENQVTFFDAGAMGKVRETPVLKKLKGAALGLAIVSPDSPRRMIETADACIKHKIPYVFDPGQQIPFFRLSDLKNAVKNCSLLIVNDYEAVLLSKTLGISKEKLAAMVPVFIETLGARGCIVKSRKEGSFALPAVKPVRLKDPTGCGDAFRAGLLAGLAANLPIKDAALAGALVATYKLESAGTQGYHFTRGEFNRRFKINFNHSFF